MKQKYYWVDRVIKEKFDLKVPQEAFCCVMSKFDYDLPNDVVICFSPDRSRPLGVYIYEED